MIFRMYQTLTITLISMGFCFAQDSMELASKSSVCLKMFHNNVGNGILYGWRHVNYNSDRFFIGGQGFTGQFGDVHNSGNYSYGGLVAGYDKRLGNRVQMDFSILAGGGGGKLKQDASGGVVVEPGLGLNWKIGKKTDFNLAGGYLWMPNNTRFTGVTVGIRFDFILK